jgi:DUF177 domain-containing protein
MPFCAHSAGLIYSALWEVAMRIELKNLEAGRGEFAHLYQPEELDLTDERVALCGPASLSGGIRQSGLEVFVTGHLKTCAQVECDRCLKPIEIPVDSDFALEYITEADYEANSTAELTEDLMSVSVFDGEGIDLDEIVKEQILLAIPTRSLCTPDCKGFCPQCGADRNAKDCGCEDREIDPRWAALQALKDGK